VISQFPPGVTHVPCDICRKPVDIRDGGDWSERWPVTHRLCENSRSEDPWTPPLSQATMKVLWTLVKDGHPLPQRAVDAILATALANSPEPWRPVNMNHIWNERQIVAVRFYLRLAILNELPGVRIGHVWGQMAARRALRKQGPMNPERAKKKWEAMIGRKVSDSRGPDRQGDGDSGQGSGLRRPAGSDDRGRDGAGVGGNQHPQRETGR